MTIDKTVDRALSKWIEEQKGNLHKRIQRLISLASWNLYYGPNMEGQDDEEDTDDGEKVVWPGFSVACHEISAAIEELPREVWVDIQSEYVGTEEPQADSYEDDNPDFDPDSPEDEDDNPKTITVVNEPCWEDYRKVEWSQIKAALFGGELAKYID